MGIIMKREFVFQEKNSKKFWNIEIIGKEFSVTYGRLGTAGRSQTKNWETEEKCKTEAFKLIAEKSKKGYKELGSSIQDRVDEQKKEMASILQGMQSFDSIGEGRDRICKYKTKHIGEIEISYTEGNSAYVDAIYNGQRIHIIFFPYSTFTEEELKLCCAIIDNYENLNIVARNAIVKHYHKNEDIQDYFDYIFENYEEDELIEIFGVSSLKKLDIKNAVEKMSFPNFSFSKNDTKILPRFVAEFTIATEPCWIDNSLKTVDPDREVLEVEFLDDEETEPGTLAVSFSFST